METAKLEPTIDELIEELSAQTDTNSPATASELSQGATLPSAAQEPKATRLRRINAVVHSPEKPKRGSEAIASFYNAVPAIIRNGVYSIIGFLAGGNAYGAFGPLNPDVATVTAAAVTAAAGAVFAFNCFRSIDDRLTVSSMYAEAVDKGRSRLESVLSSVRGFYSTHIGSHPRAVTAVAAVAAAIGGGAGLAAFYAAEGIALVPAIATGYFALAYGDKAARAFGRALKSAHQYLQEHNVYSPVIYSSLAFGGVNILTDFLTRFSSAKLAGNMAFELVKIFASIAAPLAANFAAQGIVNRNTSPGWVRKVLNWGVWPLAAAHWTTVAFHEPVSTLYYSLYNHRVPLLSEFFGNIAVSPIAAQEAAFLLLNYAIGGLLNPRSELRRLGESVVEEWREGQERAKEKREKARLQEQSISHRLPEELVAVYRNTAGKHLAYEKDGIRRVVGVQWGDAKPETLSLSRDAGTIAMCVRYTVLVPISPDKPQYTRKEDRARIVLIDAPTGNLVKTIEGAYDPVFSPDEDKLAYVSARPSLEGILIAEQNGRGNSAHRADLANSNAKLRLHDWKRSVLLMSDASGFLSTKGSLISSRTGQIAHFKMPDWGGDFPSYDTTMQLSPDGKKAYYMSGSSLIEYDIRQNKATNFFEAHKINAGKMKGYLRLSADGRFLAYYSGAEINILDLEKSERYQIVDSAIPFDIKIKPTQATSSPATKAT